MNALVFEMLQLLFKFQVLYPMCCVGWNRVGIALLVKFVHPLQRCLRRP